MKTKQSITGLIKALNEDPDKFSGIASTAKEDRDGDTLDQSGWDLGEYLKNPQILWGHNPYIPPIAKAMNVRVEDNKLKFDFVFATTDFAQEIKSLVKGGFLNTFSVGFYPKEFGDPRKGEKTITKMELLEISIVTIPSNTDAIVTSRDFNALSEKTKSIIYGAIMNKAIVEHGETKFPTLRDELEWDEEAQRRSADLEDLRVMATFVDTDAPNAKESYQLLHHAPRKEYPVVLSAIKESLDGVKSLPEEFQREAYDHLVAHLKEFGEEVPSFDAVVEAKDVKPSKQVQKTTVQEVRLSKSDRQLLERVAGVLEKATGHEVPLEATKKGRPSGRGVDLAKHKNEIVTRALQKIAKTVSKSLRDKKTKV